jgi:hypothetical protein
MEWWKRKTRLALEGTRYLYLNPSVLTGPGPIVEAGKRSSEDVLQFQVCTLSVSIQPVIVGVEIPCGPGYYFLYGLESGLERRPSRKAKQRDDFSYSQLLIPYRRWKHT